MNGWYSVWTVSYTHLDVYKRQMTQKAKKALALEIIERLKQEYPDAGCTLDYDQAWKLLVSVRLAAQCTDARVNVVVEGVYEKYPSVAALAAADVNDIEEIVRPCGLGKSKARDISACMKILHEEYEEMCIRDSFIAGNAQAADRTRKACLPAVILQLSQLFHGF